MNLNKMLMTLVLALSLTACAGNMTKQAVYTCTGIATLADVAAEGVRAHKLDAADKAKVGELLDKAAVVCEAPTPPTAEQLKQAGMEELVKLLHDKGVM